MQQKKLRPNRSLRFKLRSPGRPPVLHRAERWPFWKAIAQGHTSEDAGKRCKEMGVRPSMGSVDGAHDNAMAESFFASLECELIDRRSWKSFAEARMAVLTWIEGWYNPRRRQKSLGQKSAINLEQGLHDKATAVMPTVARLPSTGELSTSSVRVREIRVSPRYGVRSESEHRVELQQAAPGRPKRTAPPWRTTAAQRQSGGPRS